MRSLFSASAIALSLQTPLAYNKFMKPLLCAATESRMLSLKNIACTLKERPEKQHIAWVFRKQQRIHFTEPINRRVYRLFLMHTCRVPKKLCKFLCIKDNQIIFQRRRNNWKQMSTQYS